MKETTEGAGNVPINIQRIDTTQHDVQQTIAELRRRLSPDGNVVSAAGRQKTIDIFGSPLTPQQVVERICLDVRDRGTTAVLDYGNRLDHATLTATRLRVTVDELAAAHASADESFLASVRRIRDRIHQFQSAILVKDVDVTLSDGERLQYRHTPLRRAGLCVPGGAAAYPSTVLMTAVPALAAGVSELVVVAPPTKFGANNPDILAICHELGITEVYRMGGAQAVAALAYGIDGLQPVDKIVGPGNLFVALAKKFVFGVVDIDSIAGPSEVVVIADETTSAEYTAADLLAQAEHAPGASILITPDAGTVDRVAREVESQMAKLSRCELTRQCLEEFSALIRVRDREEACRLTDLIAPEHLHITAHNPRELESKIRNAGATFVGPFSPVAVGDYVAGPSHVLPTGGTARWASGLSANSFLRSSSVIEFDQHALHNVADDLREIALREQLTGHWESVAMRLE